MEICFAVVTRGRPNALPLTMPIFGPVSLKLTAARLRRGRFNVTVAEIPERLPEGQ